MNVENFLHFPPSVKIVGRTYMESIIKHRKLEEPLIIQIQTNATRNNNTEHNSKRSLKGK